MKSTNIRKYCIKCCDTTLLTGYNDGSRSFLNNGNEIIETTKYRGMVGHFNHDIYVVVDEVSPEHQQQNLHVAETFHSLDLTHDDDGYTFHLSRLSADAMLLRLMIIACEHEIMESDYWKELASKYGYVCVEDTFFGNYGSLNLEDGLNEEEQALHDRWWEEGLLGVKLNIVELLNDTVTSAILQAKYSNVIFMHNGNKLLINLKPSTIQKV